MEKYQERKDGLRSQSASSKRERTSDRQQNEPAQIDRELMGIFKGLRAPSDSTDSTLNRKK